MGNILATNTAMKWMYICTKCGDGWDLEELDVIGLNIMVCPECKGRTFEVMGY